LAEPRELVEHFFRHESGRLVALLTKSLGVARIDLVEDVVQASLMRALQAWSRNGIPDDPAAWLYRTARNLAIDQLRRSRTQARVFERLASEEATESDDEVRFAEEIGDEPLRLLFVCCHESIPVESRVALALKTLGGFSTGEVARALLTTEANAQKRIARAKEKLRTLDQGWDNPTIESLRPRVDTVLSVLYLMFNEGYNASHSDVPIRRDLCGEARRLATMLANHPVGDQAQVDALLALFCFHSGRFDSRVNSGGEVVLLEEQDRTIWDWAELQDGMNWMARSARGDQLSNYHIESAIAWEHCRAANFSETDWATIAKLYQALDAIDPSPIHTLNRAVAEAYLKDAAAGLAILGRVDQDQIPDSYPTWHAVRGELLFRVGSISEALKAWNRALEGPIGCADEVLLRKRIANCVGIV
jgi:RNA polymerase sigma factor (sigma-70 family)